MASALQRMYQQSIMTDLVLITADGVQIKVHRAVLAAQSKQFRFLLVHDTDELRAGRMKIDGIDAKTLELLVEFLYDIDIGDKLNSLVTVETLRNLLKAAYKYQAAPLWDMVKGKLEKTALAVEDCAVHYLFAKRYGLEEEVKEAVRVVRANYPQFCAADGLEKIVAAGRKTLEAFTGKLAESSPSASSVALVKSTNPETNIRVLVRWGARGNVVRYELEPTSPMSFLWAAIENSTGTPKRSFCLELDGVRLRYTDTPETLHMKEGTFLVAYLLQTG